LPNVPGYSETFFRTKIKVLYESGYRVYLFASNSNNDKVEGAKVIKPYKVEKNKVVIQSVRMLGVLLRLFVFHPFRVKRFLNKEKTEGYIFSESVKRLYINAHILQAGADWLHFGFATMAEGRESVAFGIGAKAAVSFRGYDINVYPLKNPGCYDKLWKNITKVHSISDDLYSKALKLGLDKNIPYKKITPAIDVDFFRCNDRKYKNKGTVNIVTVARLSWIKGLDTGIEAVKRLAKKGVNVKYSIIGDGPEYERLLFQIHQSGLNDKVILAGKMSREEILEYLKSCDIYIQPSFEEGFCNSLLEAQSAGCMCIASDIGGIRENILNEKTGWLVPVRSAGVLADKIMDVFGMPLTEKQVVYKNARSRIEKEFSVELQKEKFKKFYD